MSAKFEQVIVGARINLEAREDGSIPGEAQSLLDFIVQLKRRGCHAISERLPDMEKADEIYRAFRPADVDDKEAAKRKEPTKIIFPVTYSQIQTAIGLLQATFTNDPFLRVEGRTPNDIRPAKLMELELQYEFDRQDWSFTFYQWFLDMFKYGFAKVNTAWEVQEKYITTNLDDGSALPGSALFQNKQITAPQTSYTGNTLHIDDPYAIAFDPAVSIGQIQTGQFVFQQRVMSMNQLVSLADQPTCNYFNLDKIQTRSSHEDLLIRNSGGRRQNKFRDTSRGHSPIKGGETVVLDICYVRIVPAEHKLSPLRREQIWKITMANESVVIGAEPSPYAHGDFPTAIIEYSPDVHEVINDGLAQTIDGLQELINWFFNTHIANVRKVINNTFVVDPSGIEVGDLQARRNIIRSKPGKMRQGVDRILKQLNVADVTQTHVQDAGTMLRILQTATGISDNASGQALPTTRTAAEINAIQQLGSQRFKLLANTVFTQGLKPLGTQLVQNVQQFMSEDRFLKVNDQMVKFLGVDPNVVQGNLLNVSPEDIQGQFDIRFENINSPTDKLFIANKLQEFITAAIQNPQAAQALNLNVQQMFKQMMLGFGLKSVDEMFNPNGVQIQVMPDDQVDNQVQAGNLIPS